MLSLALACGGLAASSVSERERSVEAQVGSPVPVVVAARDIDAGTRLTAARAARLLAVRPVPERFAPPDGLASPEEAVGLRLSAPLPRGAYLTAPAFEPGHSKEGGAGLGPGQRALELEVSGSEPLEPGARVDVVVTTEPRAGAGRTFVALQDVELLGARPSAAPAEADRGAATLATLRVTPRQAVFLTAAANFAREVRLLARSAADRRRIGHPSVSAGAL